MRNTGPASVAALIRSTRIKVLITVLLIVIITLLVTFSDVSGRQAQSPHLCTATLDDFNCPDGRVGPNWRGWKSRMSYRIQRQAEHTTWAITTTQAIRP